MTISLFSFFSGLGLLDLGFEKNNYKIVESFEINNKISQMNEFTRQQMDLENPTFGINNIDIQELLSSTYLKDKILSLKQEQNSLVGFIGGPPCPDFSIAGKNKGAEGDNGKLTSVYFKLICENNPDFFVFENVKGIWSTKRNKEFLLDNIEVLKQHDYSIVYNIYNSLDFNVVQDRDRFIMIGIKNNIISCEMLKRDFFCSKLFASQIIKKLNWPTTNKFISNSTLKNPNNIILPLTVQYAFEKNDVTNHYNYDEYFVPRSINKFTSIAEGDISKKSFKRLHRWRYSPTAAYGNNEVHLHPYLPRRISVSEALAIQSAPKEFILPKNVDLTTKFKAIGNAVPYNMSFEIAKELKQILEGDYFGYSKCSRNQETIS